MERQGEPGMFPMSAVWRPGRLALWLAAALALAASWSVSPLARMWDAADSAIFRLLNGTIPQSSGAAALWAIGCEPRFAAFLALTLLAIFLVRLGHEKGQGFRHDMALGLSVLAVSVVLFVLHIALPDIHRPSPSASLPGHNAISTFLPWSDAGLNPLSPYPAGHAVLTGSLTVLLWMGFGPRLGLAALAFTVLLALPRIATGTEWTTDTIAGGGVAALATLA
ncbi:MAG: hypothetical protein JJ925_13055, partial [Parvibaculum sp.]|nr:hypothetical protein [Parvibaculum sp.]